MNPANLIGALAFAANKHRNQRRKDAAASPYINHPIDVASVLAVEAGITDDRVLIAAILHDTVEDTETTQRELAQHFGDDVAAMVAEVTDDKKLRKEKRKQLQIEHAPHLSNSAKLIKIADKICNVRDLAANPPAGWTASRRTEYLLWAAAVTDGCRGVNPVLEQIFDETLNRAQQSLGGEGTPNKA